MNPRAEKIMHKKFNKKLRQLLKKTKGKQRMSKKEYMDMIKKVTAAKEKAPRRRTPEQVKCLKKYNVVKVGRITRLTPPEEYKGQTLKHFVHNQELFTILHRLHLRLKHCSIKRLHQTLKLNYVNITREIVRIYIKSCCYCSKRMRTKKPKMSEEEIERRKKLTRGQIECLKMFPRGGVPRYNTLMMYHDHINMYDVAVPLGSERTDKIARVLLDIFDLFGTPDILQSTREGNFVKRVARHIRVERPGINIETEELKLDDSLKKMGLDIVISRNPNDLDVGDIFTTWTFEIADRLQHKLSDVVEGRNRKLLGEKPSPYHAMFVRNMKTSRKWAHLSGRTLELIRAENLVENRKPIVRLYNKIF